MKSIKKIQKKILELKSIITENKNPYIDITTN